MNGPIVRPARAVRSLGKRLLADAPEPDRPDAGAAETAASDNAGRRPRGKAERKKSVRDPRRADKEPVDSAATTVEDHAAATRPEERRPSVVIEANATEDALRAARLAARRRRIGGWLGFLLFVAAPSLAAAFYLHFIAVDQYVSRVSFAVRSLQTASPTPFLDLLGAAQDPTASDTQILYEYLHSQAAVAQLDAAVDLRAIYAREGADPLFRLGEGVSIERLTQYWRLATAVLIDPASGLITVEARAFDPEDARRIAGAVRDESERLINALSTAAREDVLRYALDDLAAAEIRLNDARQQLTAFRNRQSTAGAARDIDQALRLLAELRSRRSALRADYDAIGERVTGRSPILVGLERRIEAIDAQIAELQAQIATPEASDDMARAETFVDRASVEEALAAEVEFASNLYVSALAAVEAARAEARQAQRYLAAPFEPTFSEEAEYPRRAAWSAIVFLFLSLAWAVGALIMSSIRDRQ